MGKKRKRQISVRQEEQTIAVDKPDVPKRPKRNGPSMWKFFISYIFFISIFLLLIGLQSVKNFLDINGIYTQMILFLTAMCVMPFGIIQSIQGSIIHLDGISLNVLFGCNGLEAFFIYLAAILAFPASGKKKLWGILIGFVVIQGLNILRIVSLCLCAVYLKEYFYYFHVYVAQGIMIAFALVLFLFWLDYVAEK